MAKYTHCTFFRAVSSLNPLNNTYDANTGEATAPIPLKACAVISEYFGGPQTVLVQISEE